MKKRDFSEWLSTFRRSINGYEYYTDFKKVYENAERLKRRSATKQQKNLTEEPDRNGIRVTA